MPDAERDARVAISRYAARLAAIALEDGERTYEIVQATQDLNEALQGWRKCLSPQPE